VPPKEDVVDGEEIDRRKFADVIRRNVAQPWLECSLGVRGPSRAR
jgi:hypothetical protein